MPATPRRARDTGRPRARAADIEEPTPTSDNVARAYHDLRLVIVGGQLPPGSRISERVLAQRLGLSRTPAIAACISKGDPDAAQRAVEMNWHNAAERLAGIIARQGERGSWPGWMTAQTSGRSR